MVLEPGDQRWSDMFHALPPEAQDVFYAPGFAALCQETLPLSQEVRCAAFTSEEGGILLYPFVRRRTGDIVKDACATGLHDTTSLYGRGGVVGEASELDLALFHSALATYLRDIDVFCSFDRFHPVMGNQALAPPGCAARDVGGFIVVDLRPSFADLEASFKSSVRKDVRKAERNGVTCFSEANCDHLDAFLNIYYKTMDRNAASDFYYFPKSFFAGLQRHMAGQFHFFYAVHEGEIVSCELVLHHGDYCHSFLGGTLREALPLTANSLLKIEIFKRMQALDCKYFLLGGGHAPNDGIFNFKKAYAPDGIKHSFIGGTVLQPDIYARLKEAMRDAGLPTADNRFQFYDI